MRTPILPRVLHFSVEWAESKKAFDDQKSVAYVVNSWEKPVQGGYEEPFFDPFGDWSIESDSDSEEQSDDELLYPEKPIALENKSQLIDKPRFSIFNATETHTRQLLEEIKKESERGGLDRGPGK